MNGDKEFERLLAGRNLAWQQMLRAMGDALVVRGSGVVPTEEEPVASQYAFDLAGALAAPEFDDARQRLSSIRDRDELIGASRFYGIIGAESMSQEELEDTLAWRRDLMRQEDSGPMSVPRFLYETVSRTIGLGFTETSGAVLDAIENLGRNVPFLADPIERSAGMRAADRWLAMVREGFSGDLPTERGREIATGVTGAIGMFAPAYFTWELAGAVGALPRFARIGKAVTPIGRAAIRGAVTNIPLQDPTAPLHEQAVNYGLGAAFGLGDLAGPLGRTMTGAGIGYMAGAVAEPDDPLVQIISAATGAAVFAAGGAALSKVQKNFPSRVAAEAEFAGMRPPMGPTIDAAFVAEGGSAGLGAGSGTGLARTAPPPPSETGLALYDAPLAGAYPRPGEPAQLRGLLGLNPGPQEGQWSLVNDPRAIGSGARRSLPPLPIRLGAGPEEIGQAAIRVGDRVFTGRWHGEAADAAMSAGYDLERIDIDLDEGFITNQGRFLNRQQASELALANGQWDVEAQRNDAFLGYGIEPEDFAEFGPGGMDAQYVRPLSEVRLQADQAIAEAAQLTKQETILESPAFAELSNAAVLDDASVARALVESYPGQVGVVQNVSDVAGTLRKILMEQMPSGVGPQDYRVVQRPATPLMLKRLNAEASMMAGESFQFGAVTPEGAHIVGLGSVEGGNFNVAMLGPLGQGTWQAVAQTRPGAAWVRQVGGELVHQLGLQGIEVEGITGLRNTGARAGQARSASEAVLPASRFQRKTVTDILVSSGKPISNQTVKEYEQFGMFVGQRARLHTGQEVIIDSLGPDFSLVRPLHGGDGIRTVTAHILPMKSSQVVDDIPGLYEDFSQFAQVRLDEQSRQAGIMPFELLSNEGATQAPLLMEEYIRGMGTDPRSYYGASLRWLLEQKHIEAMRSLVPADEAAFLKDLQTEYKQVVEERGLPEPTLDDLAQARGFASVQEPDGSVQLTDSYSKSAAVPQFESEEAAREFLHSYQREPIDNSPVGHVPLEVVEEIPGFSMEKGHLPGGLQSPEQWESGIDEAIATAFARLGESGLWYAEPNLPAGGGGGALPPSDIPPLLGGVDEGPPDNLDLHAYTRGLRKIDGLLTKFYTPTKHAAIKIDNVLRPFGIRPIYEHVVRMQDAKNQMITKAYPWTNELIERLKGVRRQFVRNGSYVEALLAPPEFRRSIGVSKGMNELELEALDKLSELFRGFNEAETRRYIPDVDPNFVNVVERFEEMLPGDPIQRPHEARWGPREEDVPDSFVEKDIVAFGVRYFRSFYKMDLMNEPYRAIKEIVNIRDGAQKELYRQAYKDAYVKPPRGSSKEVVAQAKAEAARVARRTVKEHGQPSSLQRIKETGALPGVVNSWLDSWSDDLMWGLDPSGDILLNGAHTLLNMGLKPTGQHVSMKEVQRMFDWSFGTAYAAILGDVSSFVRDLPQGMVGAVHGGLDRGFPILGRLINDEPYRAAAVDRAFRGGWITPEHGIAVDPDVFGSMTYREASPGRELSITQQEPVARTFDFISDRLLAPVGLEHGVARSKLNALRAFGWQSDWMRVWNGMLGYENARDALLLYDEGLKAGLPPAELERELLHNSRVERFQGAIQKLFLESVRKGDYEQAAMDMGRNLADKQIRYGMTESPSFWRRLGPTTGRAAMRFQQYNSQMLAEIAQITADTDIPFKAKIGFLGQLSGMQAIATTVQALTGWNVARMGVAGALFTLAGSSIFDFVNTYQRLIAWLQGMDITGPVLDPTQQALLASGRRRFGKTYFTIDPTRALWNPWAGPLRDAVQTTTQLATWGPESAFRYLATEQTGDPSVDRRRMGLEPYGNVGLLPEDQPYYNPQPRGSF